MSIIHGFAPAKSIRTGSAYYLPAYGWFRVVDVEEPRVIARDQYDRLFEVPDWAFHDYTQTCQSRDTREAE